MRNIFIALILTAIPLGAIAQGADQQLLKVFYRSDCPPCVREMEIIPEISRENNELTIEVISFDENLTAGPLPATLPLNVHIITMKGKEKEVFDKYGNESMALPFSVMLNEDGVCKRHYGILGTRLIKRWMEAC